MNTQGLKHTRNALGAVIRGFREQPKLTQEELALRSGLHRTYIADIERGTRNPSLDSLLKLAHGLRVPLSVLFAELEGRMRAK